MHCCHSLDPAQDRSIHSEHHWQILRWHCCRQWSILVNGYSTTRREITGNTLDNIKEPISGCPDFQRWLFTYNTVGDTVGSILL